jgi:hypothetical protein
MLMFLLSIRIISENGRRLGVHYIVEAHAVMDHPRAVSLPQDKFAAAVE